VYLGPHRQATVEFKKDAAGRDVSGDRGKLGSPCGEHDRKDKRKPNGATDLLVCLTIVMNGSLLE